MRGLSRDEHHGFDRPHRTRPRTKDRPDYSSADLGRVITIDRGRFRCKVGDRLVTCTKARMLGRGSVIVGDLVRVVGDTSGQVDTLARIVEVEPRRTILRRTADDNDPYERAIVANADQIVIVTALADPEPRLGMIDRILVASYDAGIRPVLCLTKSDLASPKHLMETYLPLGVPTVVVSREADLSPLKEALQGKVSVFVGHSGVGKSTLVNALVPGADRAIGEVNEVTGKGRHTSTSAIALELPFGGWIIDTPGVRSFGLSHVHPDSVLGAFSDLLEFSADCPRGCTHRSSAPECGLDLAVEQNLLTDERLTSFRRMEQVFATSFSGTH